MPYPKFVRQINFKQLLDERPIYYVDRSYWPSWIVQLLLSDESLQKRKRDLPQLIKLKAYLEKYLDVKIVSLKIIDSPSHPVYRLQKI